MVQIHHRRPFKEVVLKTYQFSGEVFVYGNKEWDAGRGEWFFTVTTDAPLDGDSVIKVMLCPAEGRSFEPTKPKGLIARIFA